MRRRMVAGAVGLGCAGLMVLVQGTPATANRLAAGRLAGGDIARDCERATQGTPPGGPGEVRLTTDVPEGAIVEPGQEIAVSLAWDRDAWSGEELDMALTCVLVKGGLNPDMSDREAPTANDGVFEYRLVVPENIKPDCDICVEGFVAGMTADGGGQIAGSDRRCFMSGPPRPPATTPPATTPPAPEPSEPTPPAPAATPAPAPPAEDPPAEVAGITADRPAPAPAPAPAAAGPAAELPRTGPATAVGLVSAGGGLTLTFGGLAVIGGAGRRTRRRTAA